MSLIHVWVHTSDKYFKCLFMWAVFKGDNIKLPQLQMKDNNDTLCYFYLLERKNERLCTISIEIPNTGTFGSMNSQALHDSVYNIGNIVITTETSWSTLEELLSNLLTQHFQQVCTQY